jgi:hypothetical protein
LDSTAPRSTASAALLEISGHRRLRFNAASMSRRISRACTSSRYLTHVNDNGGSATPLHLAAYILWRLNPEDLKQAVATARMGARHDAVNAWLEGGMS